MMERGSGPRSMMQQQEQACVNAEKLFPSRAVWCSVEVFQEDTAAEVRQVAFVGLREVLGEVGERKDRERTG